MAPDPQCAALNAAKTKKGLTYAQIAEKIGQTEAHVTDVCTGKVKPTQAEFNALAQALDIKDSPPSDSAHATV
ncbi:Nuclear pore complex nucleoporin component [Marasmius crinis-equi]|uniref:Nuclear pore complex nucleoporin component n=1 Tax=Marasmius crinis-equi TaxID=585013 RepID=A0ABR3FJG1_9AGAR